MNIRERRGSGWRSCLWLLVFASNCGASIIQNHDNGHFYELVLDPGVTWEDASRGAATRPGDWHLATITSAEENEFIESLFEAGAPFFVDPCLRSSLVGLVCGGLWIGGQSSSNAANDWHWVTGETFSFTDWGPFEPFRNGDRLRIDEFRDRGPLFAWNDAPGNRTLTTGYIVESAGALSVTEPGPLVLVALGLFAMGTRLRRKS